MTTPTETRGVGTLAIGAIHHPEVEYRIWEQHRAGEAHADRIGMLLADADVLWQACQAPSAILELETGERVSITVPSYTAGEWARMS